MLAPELVMKVRTSQGGSGSKARWDFSGEGGVNDVANNTINQSRVDPHCGPLVLTAIRTAQAPTDSYSQNCAMGFHDGFHD